MYRARIILFGITQCKLLVKSHEINIARIEHTCFFGIIIAVILIIGGVELDPGPQM